MSGNRKGAEDLSVQAFDYVQYAFSKYHNHQVNVCIRINGHIWIKTLKKALNTTVKDLPQLTCRFYKGEYARVKSELEVELVTTECIEKEADRIAAQTLKIESGQQVRCVVIRNEREDIILLVMSHLLCDGMSMKRYMYLLCSYYNALIEEKPIVSPYKGKERGIHWLKQCDLPQKGLHRVAPRKERLSFRGGESPLFAKCRIDQSSYGKIKAYLKKNKVTMNDLFLAVYYKAVWEEFHYPLTSICCAVDLRRYIPNPDSFGLCNQTGNAYTTIDGAEVMPFKELLHKVHKQMKKEKELGFCLKQVKVLETAFDVLPHAISERLIKLCISNPQVAITNLGTIEKECITFHGLETLDCYLFPSMKKAPNFQMAVSTFEQEILLEINMIVSETEKELIERYLATYRRILLEVVSD